MQEERRPKDKEDTKVLKRRRPQGTGCKKMQEGRRSKDMGDAGCTRDGGRRTCKRADRARAWATRRCARDGGARIFGAQGARGMALQGHEGRKAQERRRCKDKGDT